MDRPKWANTGKTRRSRFKVGLISVELRQLQTYPVVNTTLSPPLLASDEHWAMTNSHLDGSLKLMLEQNNKKPMHIVSRWIPNPFPFPAMKPTTTTALTTSISHPCGGGSLAQS